VKRALRRAPYTQPARAARTRNLRSVTSPSAPSDDVYATARGPLARLASPLAARARARRHARFFALAHVHPGTRVLDVGCGRLGLRALQPELDITGVDLADRRDYPGSFVRADAAAGLPFGDDEFDLVYCSSVIEHVAPVRREAFAAELRRVGRGWFVQTPARSFPIEPHSLLPIAHWLPARLRKPYWRLGAARAWEDISLLSRGELEALFGPALPERIGPLVKSWVCVRAAACGATARGASERGGAGHGALGHAEAPPGASGGPSAAEARDVVAEAVYDEEQQQQDSD
jgi:SAM-dependent methyltransferase